MARRKSLFNWKRAFGVTKMKRSVSRATGVPLTKSGRKRKIKRFFGIKF